MVIENLRVAMRERIKRRRERAAKRRGQPFTKTQRIWLWSGVAVALLAEVILLPRYLDNGTWEDSWIFIQALVLVVLFGLGVAAMFWGLFTLGFKAFDAVRNWLMREEEDDDTVEAGTAEQRTVEADVPRDG